MTSPSSRTPRPSRLGRLPSEPSARRPSGPSARRPIRPSAQALVVGLGALLAVNLLIFAAHVGGRGQDNQGPPLPAEIESLTPVPGAIIRPQENVGADLLDTYTGVLIIDDGRIPEDQLRIVPALGQVGFRPGAGLVLTALAPGHHRATILYWPQDKDESQAKSYTWQFTAG